MLAIVSSSPDSSVLSQAKGKLSDRDTLGAIDLLQEWSEGNLATRQVTDLLDFLQLPEATVVWPPAPDTAKPAGGPVRRLWLARAQGSFFADREMPASGGLDVQRRFPLKADEGTTDLLAGVAAGSWLEEAEAYADLDLWTGVELRRSDWNARFEGGWTESNQPEAGISGLWEFKSRWKGLDLRQGPAVRYSWRRSRFVGWNVGVSGPSSVGSLDLGGSIRARQDPSWPVVLDYDSVPVRFARERAQATLHGALARTCGRLRYGPQMDLDGRVSFSPDRWNDSIGLAPRKVLTAPRSERRMEVDCTASGFVRWDPTPEWSAEGSLGWTWSAEGGAAGLDLSPFHRGPFLRLGGRSNF